MPVPPGGGPSGYVGGSRSPDAAVFGHSHLPLHGRTADGFQIFNPGSPTERRQAPRHTMAIAHAHPGELTFDLVSLE